MNLQEELCARWEALKRERSSWDAHWKEISDNLLPRSGRFLATDRISGRKPYNKILDSSATHALRTLSAGLMAGVTSPVRPWFRLTLTNSKLTEHAAVKQWLDEVTKVMHAVFQKSNTYGALQSMYEELGAFGTAVSIVAFDEDDVIHHYPLTVGEYCLAANWKNEIDTMYREFQKTVRDIVTEFGLDNVSNAVRTLYENRALDTWITLVHAIEPRLERDPSKPDNKNKAWRSVYFELRGEKNKVLRESGFNNFTVLCPRWKEDRGEIYGSSPGQEALGDIKQLQHEQMCKAQVIAKLSDPAMLLPLSLKGQEADLLPGGKIFVDDVNGSMVRQALDIKLDLGALLIDIEDVRQCLRRTFYTDIFLMSTGEGDPHRTATEIIKLHEEKLLMVGSVLQRLKKELLDPLIKITFGYLVEADKIPEVPAELQGKEVDVELISSAAQAQQAVAANSLDRFIMAVSTMAQVKPEVLDGLDLDACMKAYAEAFGVPQKVLVDPEQIAALREQRAAMEQKMQEQALYAQEANTAQKLASAKTDDQSALTDIAKTVEQQYSA